MRTLTLLILAALMMGLSSCGGNDNKEQKTQEATQAVEQKAEEVKEATNEAAEEAKQAAEETKEAAQAAASGKDGKTLFTDSGCVACHKEAQKSIGPSLKDIAAAYAGKEDQMFAFLKGKSEAIVDPPQFAVMKPNLDITKKMADEDVKAIINYIMSQK